MELTAATALFVFGTLRHRPLLSRVLDRAEDALGVVPARLSGHRTVAAAGEAFPMLEPAAGTEAAGLLVADLTTTERARVDFYEGDYGFALRPVSVTAEGATVVAQAYFPEPGRWTAGDPWDFDAWAEDWAEITTRAAEEAMAPFGTGQPGAPRFARLARGWARTLGARGAPQELRSGMTTADICDLRWKPGFDGFFRLRRFEVRHRTFSGGMSPPVSREGFAAFDAALVLPYDPVADTVLLIEQFRYGPILRDDPTPWMLEPVAGLVDAGEDPAETARREAVEEARLDLSSIEPMVAAYASPGYTSEYFHCFLGLADLSRHDGTLGGLDAENEDIRSHVVSFERAMALIDSGEINAAPLVMMLLWLSRNRERLRAAP